MLGRACCARIGLVASVALALLALSPGIGRATIADAPISGTFRHPVQVVNAPGQGRNMYIVESNGVIQLDLNGVVQSTPFLTVPVPTGTQINLYALAFAPNYATSGLFYILVHSSLKNSSADNVMQVQEFQRSATNPDVADPATQRVVITTDPMESSLHADGDIIFGDHNDLYISTGDGDLQGDPNNNSQSLSTLLGKILRIDPMASGSSPYTVPANNPYATLVPPYNTIDATGLRNPWRFSFGDGGVFIGDPGESREDEVDWVSLKTLRGANFGWNCYEGDLFYDADNTCPNATFPVYVYGPGSNPNCGSAVIGGLVVKDKSLPDLFGRYLFGDYCSGQLSSFSLIDGMATDVQPVGVTVPSLSSINVGAGGHIYVTGEPSGGGTLGELVESTSGVRRVGLGTRGR